MKRKLFVGVATILGLAIIVALVTASIWPVMNSVETGRTPAYPDVLPMYYSTDPARVFDEAKLAVDSMERWEVVSSDTDSKVITATRTTRLFGFVDDVQIRVEPETEFVTRVHMTSTSRAGKGDFGQNARNVHAFFEELNKRLGAVRFIPGEDKK